MGTTFGKLPFSCVALLSGLLRGTYSLVLAQLCAPARRHMEQIILTDLPYFLRLKCSEAELEMNSRIAGQNRPPYFNFNRNLFLLEQREANLVIKQNINWHLV